MINTQYLDEKIKESGKSKKFLAEKVGITRSSFYSKISGRTDFSGEEFIKLIAELNVPEIPQEVRNFFCSKVQTDMDLDNEVQVHA